MTNCICVECDHKCYEYYNNVTSDKAYYEWGYKQDKCLQAESEVQDADID